MNGNLEDSTRSEKFSEKFMSHVCRKHSVAMILWCVVAVTVVGGGWLLLVVVGCFGWLLVVAGYPLTPRCTRKPPHYRDRTLRFYPMGQECEKVNVPRSQRPVSPKKGWWPWDFCCWKIRAGIIRFWGMISHCHGGGSVAGMNMGKQLGISIRGWFVEKTWLGGGFKTFFYFHPYLGKISNLTHIFQIGWNHQPGLPILGGIQTMQIYGIFGIFYVILWEICPLISAFFGLVIVQWPLLVVSIFQSWSRDMRVSKNRGIPKWMIYNGNPYKNGWFGGTTIFGKHPNLQVGTLWVWAQRRSGSVFPTLVSSARCGSCMIHLLHGHASCHTILMVSLWIHNLTIPRCTGILGGLDEKSGW